MEKKSKTNKELDEKRGVSVASVEGSSSEEQRHLYGKGNHSFGNSANFVVKRVQDPAEHLRKCADISDDVHLNDMEENSDKDDSTISDPKLSLESSSETLSQFESGSSLDFEARNCRSRNSVDIVSRQQEIRKNFQDVVKRARRTLAEARVLAQEESVAKRYEAATQKKRELQKRRAQKRREMLSAPTPTAQSANVVISSKVEAAAGAVVWDRTEIKEIRKVHAELDRARAKKSQAQYKKDRDTSAAVSGPILHPLYRKSEFDKYEIDRLVKELHSLNLADKASSLAEAYKSKMDLEQQLRSELKREKREALLEAKRQRLEELARLKEEEKRKQLEEKKRRELERKRREEEERMRQLEEDRKRKVHNLQLWSSFHRAGFDTSVSRAFTTSYFPKLNESSSSSKNKVNVEYARLCSLRLKKAHKAHTNHVHKQ